MLVCVILWVNLISFLLNSVGLKMQLQEDKDIFICNKGWEGSNKPTFLPQRAAANRGYGPEISALLGLNSADPFSNLSMLFRERQEQSSLIMKSY